MAMEKVTWGLTYFDQFIYQCPHIALLKYSDVSVK